MASGKIGIKFMLYNFSHKQKKEERYYLEVFKEKYNNFPDGQIYAAEKPDFLIHQSSFITGIELTKISQKNLGFNIQTNEKDFMHFDIKNRIREGLIKMGIIDYEIHLDMHINKRLIKAERENVANKLMKIILNNLPNRPYDYTVTENDFRDLENFPEIVGSINIIKVPKLKAPFVTDATFGFMQDDMIDLLQERISNKNIKVELYKKKCSRIWLLIYSDSTGWGSFFSPSEKTLEHEYESNFNKVFFLNSFDKDVYELKLQKSNADGT